MAELARSVRAFLIAPLTAPVVYWLAMVGAALVEGRAGRLRDAPGALPVIVAFGAPVAYAMTLLLGVPLYLVARRSPGIGGIGGIGGVGAAAVGAAGGVVLSLVLAPYFRGELFSIPFPPWLGLLAGATTAAVWWRLAAGADRSRRRPA